MVYSQSEQKTECKYQSHEHENSTWYVNGKRRYQLNNVEHKIFSNKNYTKLEGTAEKHPDKV